VQPRRPVNYRKLTRELRMRGAAPAVYMLALYVAEFGDQGSPRLGLRTLGAAVGIAKGTASRAIEAAIADGWIEATPDKNGHRFRLADRWYKTGQKLTHSEDRNDGETQNGSTNGSTNGSVFDPLSGARSPEERNGSTSGSISDPLVDPLSTGTPVATCAGDSSRKPLKTSPKKTDKTTKVDSKTRNGASAAASPSPDRSPEDDKLEQFEAWLGEQEPGYRELFEYAASALGAPCKTTSARKRAEAASAVRAIYRDGCTLEDFKAVRREYDRDPWRDRQTGRKIPLSPKILRERYADLLARARDPDEGDEPQTAGAEVIELPKRGNGNGQHAKTFNEQRDEYEAAKLRAIDGAIEDALAGRDEPAAPGGRHGDLEEGPPGGRPRLAGPRDASDPRRHLG
jgi:hypothetical protein